MNKFEHLRSEIVEKLTKELELEEIKKMRVEIPVGFGGTSILVDIIRKRINREENIVVLISSLVERVQFEKELEENGLLGKVSISTYGLCSKSDFLLNGNASLILCKEVHGLNGRIISSIGKLTKTRIILLETSGQRAWNEDEDCLSWVDSFKLVFSYSFKQAIEDGYVYQFYGYQLVEEFCIELLHYLGYQNVQRKAQNQVVCYDIVAEGAEKCIFEIKSYKNIYNSQKIIHKAIEQALTYKDDAKLTFPGCEYYLIMLCHVDKNIKESAYDSGIVIWDISNIMFLCQGNQSLTDKISSITDFSIKDVVLEEPLEDKKVDDDDKRIVNVPEKNVLEKKKYELYKKQLDECATGKNEGVDKQYEMICSHIIKELFEDQFSRMSEQYCTTDEMFRMDMVCSLKGGTTFWDFLINFYRTKFVVFEFKNYKDLISQNLIYISEKYLYTPALRNVAFIISRKGFDKNAKKAAKGCLIEHGKLIIELKDEDLLCMLRLKDNGQEPSDYLMEKIEDILMGISK
ncbi:MAG: hypothetical protein IJA01_03335 [Firmicutes bacterium]|nr:hypothetical protein [Bacillota bacterium]